MPECYIPLQVGRAEPGHGDLGYKTDADGEDHISDMNHLFGELTGLYWIWKNDRDSDIIGICHYRRYFADDNDALLKADDYVHILSDDGVLLSQCIPCEETYRENFTRAHHKQDVDALDHGIKVATPDYLPEYNAVMDGHKRYFGNLLVMKRKDYMSYCSWLFDVLLASGEKIDVDGYDAYHARIYGFLSEELAYVWALHNKKIIHEGRVILTAEKTESVELRQALSVLISQRRITEAKQMFEQVTTVRPDVTLKSADLSGDLKDIWEIILICEKEAAEGKSNLLDHSTDINELLTIIRQAKQKANF